jgi:hypothetical protein
MFFPLGERLINKCEIFSESEKLCFECGSIEASITLPVHVEVSHFTGIASFKCKVCESKFISVPDYEYHFAVEHCTLPQTYL